MTPHQAYEQYLAIRLHFQQKDFTIKNILTARIPVKEEVFFKRGLRITGLLRKHPTDLHLYFLANFVAGDEYGGLYSSDGESIYRDWRKRKESLSYIFEQDLRYLLEKTTTQTLREIFQIKGGHPILLRAYFGKFVCPETLVFFDRLIRFRETYDVKLSDDLMWPKTSHLIKKYGQFVECDMKKVKHVVMNLCGV